MARHSDRAIPLKKAQARRIWLRAQRLDEAAPFGAGPGATPAAIAHLGYVQIDTINVVERCHHHSLYTRIPDYRREHLHRAQSEDKSVFEYRAHALAYIPAADYRFYAGRMKEHWTRRRQSSVKPDELRKVLARIREHGALSLRDIDDDVLTDKGDGWASRKPSAHALRLAFYGGKITVSRRTGILKTYELTDRHFSWSSAPKPAAEKDVAEYILDRALRSQGIVSLDSVCHLDARRKPLVRQIIETRLRRKELLPVAIEGAGKQEHWTRPATLDVCAAPVPELIHILSPFDPLIIQRKRLKLFFDYDHIFEAYVPKPKRKYGYFALPVLAGGRIVAAIDLKTDRDRQELLIRQWTWLTKGAQRTHKKDIEAALHRFERFQLEQ
ncbi:MAG: crosslink repair DNA glycosylase YcaQ family protein [Rhizomicrobium sp.]